MAQHGGASGLARAHRPRAPIMSIPVPLTAPLAPLRPPIISSSTSITGSSSAAAAAAVSLVQPRPENERTTNEYVETPFRSAEMCVPQQVPPPHPPRNPHPRLGGRLPIHPTHHHLPPPPPPPSSHHHQHHHRLGTITKQPTTTIQGGGSSRSAAAAAAAFVKDGGSSFGGGGGLDVISAAAECQVRSSIVCSECGRCRCDSCRVPRALPQRWVCGDSCLLSADTVIDYASCLCCVKGVFYHCSETDEGGGGESCADEPCGCQGDRRAARWTCLTTLSCVLPCLLLYWPLQGAKTLVEHCYARHTRKGCRCRPDSSSSTLSTSTNTNNATTPEKRLLSSNADF